MIALVFSLIFNFVTAEAQLFSALKPQDDLNIDKQRIEDIKVDTLRRLSIDFILTTTSDESQLAPHNIFLTVQTKQYSIHYELGNYSEIPFNFEVEELSERQLLVRFRTVESRTNADNFIDFAQVTREIIIELNNSGTLEEARVIN